MATNAEKTKLFVDRSDPNNPKGITLAEMMQVLGYYKRDKNGKRNLGMIYTNAEIKKYSKNKPFPHEALYFETSEERDAARKGEPNITGISQALKLPMVRHMIGLIDLNYRWTYLAQGAAYFMMTPQAPNYEYVICRGSEHNDHFRMLDMDGYTSTDPMMPIWRVGVQNYANGQTHVINRFVTDELKCYIMANPKGGDHLTLDDIIHNADKMRFVVEQYNGTKDYYTKNIPDELYVADDIAKNVTYTGQHITVPLSDVNDGKIFTLLMGINEINPETMLPYEANGLGMFPPKEGGVPWTWFDQQYFGVFAFVQDRYFWLPAGSSKFTSRQLKDYTSRDYDKNYSDVVGISIKVYHWAERYYIKGANPATNIPSNAKRFMFKMENPMARRQVVGMISDETLTTSSNTKAIERGTIGTTETVYLRFEGFIKSGEKVDSAILYISADDGQTWTTVDPTASKEQYGFEFAKDVDCDSSSIKLLLEGTI